MKRILVLFLSLVAILPVAAQYPNGIGINVNAGYTSRLNATLVFETRIKNSLFLRANVGYGNLLKFNVDDNHSRMFVASRFDAERINHARHIDLLYNGFQLNSGSTTISAPEARIGVLYMTGLMRKKNCALSGIYVGYQAAFAVVSESYKNIYVTSDNRSEEIIEGKANYFSFSPVNILFGYKKLIGNSTTLDIGLEQSLGVVLDEKFKSQREFYHHPYSGLKFDLSVGIRKVF